MSVRWVAGPKGRSTDRSGLGMVGMVCGSGVEGMLLTNREGWGGTLFFSPVPSGFGPGPEPEVGPKSDLATEVWVCHDGHGHPTHIR